MGIGMGIKFFIEYFLRIFELYECIIYLKIEINTYNLKNNNSVMNVKKEKEWGVQEQVIGDLISCVEDVFEEVIFKLRFEG